MLQEYKKSLSTEIRRARLLELCQNAYNLKYRGVSDLGHSTFNRCLDDLEEEMAIKRKKIGNKHTVIIIEVQRVRKMINDIKSQQGLYQQDAKVTLEDIERARLEPFLQQGIDAMLDNYSRPWISHINEQHQEANLIAQRCASRIAAILISSRFGFTQRSLKDGSFKSIDKNHLYELAIITSKIASKSLEEPFHLLIDYSGLPGQVGVWIKMFRGDLLREIIPHFETFAERVFKFEFTNDDLNNLRQGNLDKLSKPLGRLFDIFCDHYLLPTFRTIGSKSIKLE